MQVKIIYNITFTLQNQKLNLILCTFDQANKSPSLICKNSTVHALPTEVSKELRVLLTSRNQQPTQHSNKAQNIYTNLNTTRCSYALPLNHNYIGVPNDKAVGLQYLLKIGTAAVAQSYIYWVYSLNLKIYFKLFSMYMYVTYFICSMLIELRTLLQFPQINTLLDLHCSFVKLQKQTTHIR